MLFFNICKIMCLKLPLEEEMLNSADAVASDILFVVLGTISITFLATIFPAKAAGKVMPAEALRYGN